MKKRILDYGLLIWGFSITILFGEVGYSQFPEIQGDQGRFFRQYWAEFDESISNNPWGRLRVNDAGMSVHPEFGNRPEAQANGLQLVRIEEELRHLEKAEIYLEIWGGHPHTVNKRLSLNGRGTYPIPEVGAALGHCVYSYPVIPIKISDLVSGTNAIQFSCDRGDGFWGHYIVDEMAVRVYLKPEHPDLKDLQAFVAGVEVYQGKHSLSNQIMLSLPDVGPSLEQIASVEYFGHYSGFDEDGDRMNHDWHGFTHDRIWKGHLGTSDLPPFQVEWITRYLPTQSEPMSVRALVRLKNGLFFWTDRRDGIRLDRNRPLVEMIRCHEMPIPFWSRDSNEKTAFWTLPDDLSAIESARLMIKVWDGGEGQVKAPFKINGHAYPIVSGKAVHDVVFTSLPVSLDHLKPGRNTLTLFSDTDHHGIEILLPGPVLFLRYR